VPYQNGIPISSFEKQIRVVKVFPKLEKKRINIDHNVTLNITGNSSFVRSSIFTIGNPELSTPQNPNLYALKVTLSQNDKIIDVYFTQFGIRTIRTEESKVLLNDKIIFLTGAARHKDHPLYGRSMPKELIFDDAVLTDSSNINYVRTARYPDSH